MTEPFGFNEPASQYIPKPSAVSTGELIDSLLLCGQHVLVI